MEQLSELKCVQTCITDNQIDGACLVEMDLNDFRAMDIDMKSYLRMKAIIREVLEVRAKLYPEIESRISVNMLLVFCTNNGINYPILQLLLVLGR